MSIKTRSAFLLALFFSPTLFAADIIGHIKGDKLQWLSATNASGYLVPTAWDQSHNLPQTQKWVPGGAIEMTAPDLTLKNHGGDSLNLGSQVLEVTGIDYQSARILDVKHIYGAAKTHTLNANSVSVMGAGMGDKELMLVQLEVPFTHIRPIIKLNEAQLRADFKTFPKGEYRGQTVVTLQYDYDLDGARIRNTLTFPLSLVINHDPTELVSIVVTGENEMQPIYQGQSDIRVSGSTEYTITATGNFSNGVLIGLRPPLGGNHYFTLRAAAGTTHTETKDTINSEIKYDVTCITGCDGRNRQLIKDGIGLIDTQKKRAKMLTDATSGTATIKVHFENKKLDELNNASYSGAFILLFEAGM